MDALAQILTSLGIDKSLFYQLGLCVLLYGALFQILFKDLFKAYLSRKIQTSGSEKEAVLLAEEQKKLEQVYETKARQLNAENKKIFNQVRQEAYEKRKNLIEQAEKEAQQFVVKNREILEQQTKKAYQALEMESKDISKQIVSCLTQH